MAQPKEQPKAEKGRTLTHYRAYVDMDKVKKFEGQKSATHKDVNRAFREVRDALAQCIMVEKVPVRRKMQATYEEVAPPPTGNSGLG